MVLDSSSAPPPLVPCGVRAPADLRLPCVLLTGHHLAGGILRYVCEVFQQRGGVVKALTPKTRPSCDRQVGEL